MWSEENHVGFHGLRNGESRPSGGSGRHCSNCLASDFQEQMVWRLVDILRTSWALPDGCTSRSAKVLAVGSDDLPFRSAPGLVMIGHFPQRRAPEEDSLGGRTWCLQASGAACRSTLAAFCRWQPQNAVCNVRMCFCLLTSIWELMQYLLLSCANLSIAYYV